MNILVTGAAGYIGSVLVPKLLKDGHFVTAVDRFFFGETLPCHDRLEKVAADARRLDKALLTVYPAPN